MQSLSPTPTAAPDAMLQHAQALLKSEAERFAELAERIEKRRYPALMAAAGFTMMTLGVVLAVLMTLTSSQTWIAVAAVGIGAMLLASGSLTWHFDQKLKIDLYRLESEMRFRHATLEANTAIRELEILAAKSSKGGDNVTTKFTPPPTLIG